MFCNGVNMQCFPKVFRYFYHTRSIFISSVERSDRYIYSISPAPEIAGSFSKDLKTLNDLWEKKQNLAEVNDFLFKCFSRQSDCYSFTLDMIKYCCQKEYKSGQELNFAILLAFDTWLEQNIANQPLTLEIKQKALELLACHKYKGIVSVLSKVYNFRDDSMILREYIDKLISGGECEEACFCVIALGIQSELPFEKILLPLMQRNKVHPILKYLEGHSDLQLKFAKRLDAFIQDPNNVSGKEYGLKFIKQKESKIASKILATIIKVFGIPAELFPNMLKFKSIASMYYLIHKKMEKSMPDDSWESLIADVVENYPDLQKRLICKLVSHKELSTAAKMAKRFNIPLSDWSMDVIESSENTGNPTVDDEKPVSESQTKNSMEYLSLDVSRVHIQFVRSKEEFFDCLNDISQNHNIIGVDSEWKMQFGFTQSRLSLMQLSVSNKVYLLDMLSLDECLIEENWNSLMDLFSNPQILKLGCGIIQDVQMLVENYKGTPHKAIGFSHVLDVAVLFEQLQELYEEELKEFSNDAPGVKGLSKLCKILLGKYLNKDERICDWEIRPLSDSQVTYAALDAHCLLQMFEKMQACAKEHSVDFEKSVTITLNITAGFSKIALKNKLNYRWERQALGFEFRPLIAVTDFKVIIDGGLMALTRKLRIFGVDVTVLKEGQTYVDGVKIACDENRVYVMTGDHVREVKSLLPEEKYYLVSGQAGHDENTVAHIFWKYNVHITSKTIFSRCTNCNTDDFLSIPSDDLKNIWITAHSKKISTNCTKENSDCDHELNENGESSASSSGMLNSGVQIQLKKLPFNVFSDVQTFQVCKNCGNVHYQR